MAVLCEGGQPRSISLWGSPLHLSLSSISRAIAVCAIMSVLPMAAVHAGPTEDAKAAQDAYAKRDFAKSLALATPAAEAGNAVAQTILGFHYDTGAGVRQNPEVAVTWFKKAAAQGYALGQFGLGTMFARGRGVSTDAAEAVKYYRMAAVQDLPLARMALGRAYMVGDGVAQSDAEAVTWYREPAEQGYASAQAALGLAYYNGKGVAENKETGLAWLTRAAEQDDVQAQINLGIIALDKNTDADDKVAVAWFRRAAVQGFVDAQNALGQAYSIGRGVEKNKVLAYMWLALSAVDDYPEAINDRDTLRKEMNAAEIAQGEKLARGCKQSQYQNCPQ
jgi:TPR repeat protein